MTTPQPKSAFELLAIAVVATGALFALNYEWRLVLGGDSITNLLFAPLMLASIYLALRWFGFNTNTPLWGIQPRIAWTAALLVIILWASLAPPLAKLLVPFVGIIVLRIHGRFTHFVQGLEEAYK
ncbi:hypothetical protein FF011L_38620 [Roseimaritima multifibrata]|uniref:Uncharacterized protein n=1 Tax=Roseimaritima multifibrata TaxID=1930274 RepID=A0A517MJN5_9BACT|nr:DUF4175 domain-containing protein [Roseimaritima multifibrata]QDS95078.1 hypothetical protein FF011L_38620 [Roseimaritima multifibrata]